MLTKKCGRCKEVLEVSAFHKCSRESSGLQSWCKVCRKAHKHPERLQYFRDFYYDNPDKYLDSTYKRRYGISLAEYNTLLADQKGVCYLCQGVCNTGRRLAVDHSHLSGNVRKLLCGNCNKGLGNFQDSVELLQKAIDYLKENK